MSFRCHNVATKWKGLNQSNIVCEYEVNMSTDEKVITENKTTLTQIVKEQCWIEYHGHLKVKVMIHIGEKVLT